MRGWTVAPRLPRCLTIILFFSQKITQLSMSDKLELNVGAEIAELSAPATAPPLIETIANEAQTTDQESKSSDDSTKSSDTPSTPNNKSEIEMAPETLPTVASAPTPSNKQAGQTKVISLDTIIRKGLSEQMPMTAKDINNIVPNAIKNQMPSSSLAVSTAVPAPVASAIAATAIVQQQTKLSLVDSGGTVSTATVPSTKPTMTSGGTVKKADGTDLYYVDDDDDRYEDEEDDDDYDDDYDEDNDDLIIEAKLREKAELEARQVAKNGAAANRSYVTDDGTSLKRKSLDLHDEHVIDDDGSGCNDIEPTTTDGKKDCPPSDQLLEPMAEIPFDPNIPKSSGLPSSTAVKPKDPKDAIEYYDEEYSSEGGVARNDDQQSWHSFSDMDSSESDAMSRKKRRRRSATTKDDDDDYSPTNTNKKKKKMSMAAKRKPGRPKRRDDEMMYYRAPSYGNAAGIAATNSGGGPAATLDPTPMDELISMGHSVFAEYGGPKRLGGRRRKDNFEEYFKDTAAGTAEREKDTTLATQADASMEVGRTVVSPDHLQLFRRKPGRPKIDKESGGHIVFQNSEVTLVNKVGGGNRPQSAADIYDDQLTPSIRPADKLSSGGGGGGGGTTTKLQKRMSDIEIVPIMNRKSAQEYHESAGGLMMAPIDDMLEVHHIEEYKEYEAADARHRRGRKQQKQATDNVYSRTMYTDYDGSSGAGIMTIIPSTSTAGSLQGRHRPIVETVKVEVHSSETQEQPIVNVPVTSTTSGDTGATTGAAVNVVGKIRARRTSQLTEITKDPTMPTQNERYKRVTATTKPTYYEWSENSNDNVDNGAAPMSPTQKARKPHWRTLQKQRVANRQKGIHWKTQQRLINQERMKASFDDSGVPAIVEEAQPATENDSVGVMMVTGESVSKSRKFQSKLDDITLLSETRRDADKLPATDAAAAAAAVPVNVMAEAPATGDELTTKRKRIPKLKFGSYNFNERRDGSKPKMVLKYKKKYKKKPKKVQPHELVTTQMDDVPDVDDISMVADNEAIDLMPDEHVSFI